MKITPRIQPPTAEFLEGLFRSRNAGAEFVLETAPVLYRRALNERKGFFSEGELSLIIDVMNSTFLNPGLLGQHLEMQCQDGISLDGLDD